MSPKFPTAFVIRSRPSLGPLVEVEQVLAVAGLLEEVLLFGEHEVGVAGHRRAVGHEVRH